MKKLMFAVALVAFSFAGMANEKTIIKTVKTADVINLKELVETSNILKIENKLETLGTCYVTIGFYDSDGNKVAERTLQIEGVNSAEECSQLADDIAAQL
ncbi:MULTISPECIES: hypothetical protein [Flavobacterium]|uniref:Uncharacterized protein n=1 Tax=Flavobacterium jumunjinense TaxID=998845 RepID=A0ABV5GQH1_9FLAO|nr:MULTISPECIES: hypothetical protein [Flavobacterium]